MALVPNRFEDAQSMALQYPTTFFAPSNEDLSGIEVGDHVKICAIKERFWVRVISINGSVLTGKVDNDLVCTPGHGIKFGDSVEFEFRHIYAILK